VDDEDEEAERPRSRRSSRDDEEDSERSRSRRREKSSSATMWIVLGSVGGGIVLIGTILLVVVLSRRGPGRESGTGTENSKVSDETAWKVNTRMSLEELEAILGKGKETTMGEAAPLWAGKPKTTASIERFVELFRIGRWYTWANGNTVVTVGMARTSTGVERVSVLVRRDFLGRVSMIGTDPEKVQ
jgi:hypothetical protein